MHVCDSSASKYFFNDKTEFCLGFLWPTQYNQIWSLFWECLSSKIFIGLKSCLKKKWKIDNEARTSKKAKMKIKFNRNQKQITLTHPANILAQIKQIWYETQSIILRLMSRNHIYSFHFENIFSGGTPKISNGKYLDFWIIS